ncbi:MAG: FAD-dependent oxidoreductase [Oscillospiraceae bacterium]|nr:FAD-dependent oxidoreductase [Oscillospiraceae bacterium]
MTDVIVIGGGPAGLSAAVNIRARDRSVLVISNPIEDNPLYLAPRIDNYPGLPGISGAQLLERLKEHADRSGAELFRGSAQAVMPSGKDGFIVSAGGETVQASAVVIATGVRREKELPGERELLGKGVSWCATCDGRLFRGRDVVVVGLSPDAPEEAAYLQDLGCRVTYVSEKTPDDLPEGIPMVRARDIAIQGEQTVTSVRAGETVIPCQGVFVLRRTFALNDLFPQLTLRDGYVITERPYLAAGVPGVFACGDCTGPLHQAAAAVGQGQAAGLGAAAYIQNLN